MWRGPYFPHAHTYTYTMHTLLVRYRLPGDISLFDAGETCKAFLRLWRHRASVLHKHRLVKLYALCSAFERFKMRLRAFKRYKQSISRFFSGWKAYTRIGPLTPGWTYRLPCPYEIKRHFFRRWVTTSRPWFRRLLKKKAFTSLKLYVKRRNFMRNIFLHWWHFCDINLTDSKAKSLEAAYLRDQQAFKRLQLFKNEKKMKIQQAVDDYKKETECLRTLRSYPAPLKSLKRRFSEVEISWLLDTREMRV